MFAYGEQASVATIHINEETSVTGITIGTPHKGDGTTALSTYLTGATGWTAADTTQWKGFAHVCLRIDCKQAQLPSSLVVSAKLGGRKCTPLAGGAKAATANPAVIAADIRTSAEWNGLATSRLNTASYQLVEAWSDEVMADTNPRYEVGGVITERNPGSAAAQVLKVAQAYEYAGADGLIHLWADMAPLAISGTWTATASTALTGSGGAASTELSPGDWAFIGTELRQVFTVINNDSVQIYGDPVTVSAVKVRPFEPVVISKADWLEPPSLAEDSNLRAADIYKVAFEDSENLGQHSVTVSYGSDTDKVSNDRMLCTEACYVARSATT